MSDVHPLFYCLAAVAAVGFAGLIVWSWRFKHAITSLVAVLVLLSAIIGSGAYFGREIVRRETRQLRDSEMLAARILGISIQAKGHSLIRLDGSTDSAKAELQNWLDQLLRQNHQVSSIQTVRKTPSGVPQTIIRAGSAEDSDLAAGSANNLAFGWQGTSGFAPNATSSGKALAAIPIKNPRGEIEALVLVAFNGPSGTAAGSQSQTGILVLTSALAFIVLTGAAAAFRMSDSLAQARVARIELAAQGERIREQMDIIAEKNQAMAASHDALASANAKLQSLATLDGLTGVMNHRSLMEFLTTNMKRSSVIGSPSSVILMDVDNFKSLNDQYGHIAGDEALRTIASVLKQSCPKGAGVGRYGGEEFMMVLPGASETSAIAVAEELRRRVQMAKTTSRAVTVSVGVSTVYSMSKSEQALIDEADKALYQAKRTGKNRVIHFGHGLLESA
ncbi:MAG: GGDEF domain-containing protein [Armatimonadetes bacterium]|nr:GGDEF domain-containing protein [Armatimonadota bacterium]